MLYVAKTFIGSGIGNGAGGGAGRGTCDGNGPGDGGIGIGGIRSGEGEGDVEGGSMFMWMRICVMTLFFVLAKYTSVWWRTPPRLKGTESSQVQEGAVFMQAWFGTAQTLCVGFCKVNCCSAVVCQEFPYNCRKIRHQHDAAVEQHAHARSGQRPLHHGSQCEPKGRHQNPVAVMKARPVA
jgi:hypothetical protein